VRQNGPETTRLLAAGVGAGGASAACRIIAVDALGLERDGLAELYPGTKSTGLLSILSLHTILCGVSWREITEDYRNDASCKDGARWQKY
jgi:hypothetical protein